MSNANSNTKPAAKPKLSSIALYVVLALLIAALGYDYGVARPAVEKAYAMLDEKSIEMDDDPERVLTRGTIGELMGRSADMTIENGTSTVDVYQWTSGLPFRTHDLYVSYKISGGTHVFFRLEKFGYETEVPSGDAPNEPNATTTTGDQIPSNMPAVDAPEEATENPSFESIDDNSDGKLDESEMPEIEQADSDGDGTVSKSEYEQYVR